MSDSTISLVLNAGSPLLPKQEQLLKSKALVNACLGAWGSGKTRASVLALLANCIRNPWTPVYGDDRPFSLLVAPTHKVLKDSAYREFKAVCPKELILREWRSPDWEVLLANGHILKMRTIRGSLEGASAVGILIDEIQMVPDEKIWLNYQSRAREPRANNRIVIASGVPHAGWMQTIFDGHENDPNRLTLFMAATENTYLPAEVLEQFRRSAPGKAAEAYINGRWIQSAGDRVYYEFDGAAHLTGRQGARDQPVHIGFDVGVQSAAVFAQTVKVRCKTEGGRPYDAVGLHIVDELKIENESTEACCRKIRERGWMITDESCFMIDPMTRRDEIEAVRRVFPTVNLIRKSKRGTAAHTEPGHHAVNCALKDADGNIRLTFSRDMAREPGTLYHSILNFKRAPGGKPIRNDRVDHFCDALRYIVAHLLPVQRSGVEVIQRI